MKLNQSSKSVEDCTPGREPLLGLGYFSVGGGAGNDTHTNYKSIYYLSPDFIPGIDGCLEFKRAGYLKTLTLSESK